MYVWQFAIDTDCVIIGRSWDDYRTFISLLEATMTEDERLVVYVHNLSYEINWLSAVFNFENEDVFCTGPHKVLRAITGNIEYRCSMLHSNMSLAKWTENLDVKHKKLSGEEYDYNIVRYPWTDLKQEELHYQINDVLGVVECIKTELFRDNDNLYTIPLTSTGYVRRNVKRAMRPVSHRLNYQLHLEEDVYLMLKKAFRGGDTHANRFYVNRILHNVKSYDRSSSYPDVMINGLFPCTKFTEIPYITTLEAAIEDIVIRERACLADIAIYNYSQKDRYNGFPYLSLSKCRNIKGSVIDNGRVLEADYLETTVTEIDLEIIIHEMSEEGYIKILRYFTARKARLPEPLRNEIMQYYKGKTELKGIEGKEYFYMKSKNLLNSIYGLTVQDPCKDVLLFADCQFEYENLSVQAMLDKYYEQVFLYYAYGIWVTALARLELRRALWVAGHQAVYCDTDSVKYIGEVDFTDLNKRLLNKSIKNSAFALDRKGNKRYMGVFELDGTYKRFATLGAKKYVYEDDTGLHITIAGVNKKKGAEELQKAGGIERFLLPVEDPLGNGAYQYTDKGFTFREAGGHELIYNPDKTYGFTEIEGHKLEVIRNVVIKDSTYQLGVARDYKIILEGIVENYLEEFYEI